MRYFHKQPNHFWKPIINLDKVLTTSFPSTTTLFLFLVSLDTMVETWRNLEMPAREGPCRAIS